MDAIRERVAYTPGATHAGHDRPRRRWRRAAASARTTRISSSPPRALLGFPARYVSGYLMMDDDRRPGGQPRLGRSHVAGLGWVAFDAANGISPDERYVRVATGRDYRDAMPVSGIRLGQAEEQLAVTHHGRAVIPRMLAAGSDSMTYCVGLKIDRGLVFMSDTRTNAGIDRISTFRKMHVWEEPGERVIVLMSAGNLATTQAVVSLLDERTKAVAERSPTLLETPSMYQTARLVGNTVKEVIASSVAGRREGRFLLQRLLHPRRPDHAAPSRGCS